MSTSRTLTNEMSAHIGEQITIQGWLHKKRLLGGLNFITLRDRRGIAQSLLDNKDEVEKVFTVPLSWLLTHEPYMHLISFQPVPSSDFPFDKIMNGAQYEWRTRLLEEWFFEYEDYTIWGMTARILKHFVHLLNGDHEFLE